MLDLNNFFEPILGLPILHMLICLWVWDITGFLFRTKSLKIDSSEWRFLDWLLGFGLFILIWFLIGHFIAPTQMNISVSLAALTIFGASFLKRDRSSYKIWHLPSLLITLIAISPHLYAVFVKASLPPYYSDEMSYHFYPPVSLKTLGTWEYSAGVFGMVPRLLDTWYILGFSYSHTQVLGRVVHFLIHFTVLVYVYHVLKKHISFWAGLLFLLMYVGLPQYFAFHSTIGFVDIANVSLILAGVISGMIWIKSKEDHYFYFSAIFWGMGLGVKYSGLTIFAVFVLCLLAILFLLKKEDKPEFSAKTISRFLGIFILFGGYWYIKNLVLTGNPIFPFVFPCYRWSEACSTGSSFFGTWTTAVNFESLPKILSDLMIGKGYLIVGIVISSISILFTRGKNRILLCIPIALVAIDLMIIKFLSGFFFRYHQYMQLILILFVAIGLVIGFLRANRSIRASLIILAFVSSILTYIKAVKAEYEESHLPKAEVDYALRKTDIWGYLNYRLPTLVDFIRTCNQPPNKEPFTFVRVNPDLIWWGDDAKYMHQYFTNCTFAGTPFSHKESLETLKARAIAEKLEFFVLSTASCVPQNEVKKTYTYEDEESLELRRLDNFMICHAEVIVPELFYKFSYTLF